MYMIWYTGILFVYLCHLQNVLVVLDKMATQDNTEISSSAVSKWVDGKKGSGKWEDRFQEVVWAKSGSFPWWPSYVIDPALLSTAEEGYNKAHKLIGKQYVVLFYADRTLGFISPKDMKPFNEQTLETYSAQKVSNKYKLIFPKAIEEASADFKLNPVDRLAWYFANVAPPPPVTADDFDDNEEASYFEEDPEASVSLGFDLNDKEIALLQNNTASTEKKETKRKTALENLSEEEENPSESESNENLSDSFSEDRDTEIKPKKKRLIRKKRKASEIDARGTATNKRLVDGDDDNLDKRKRGRPKGSINKKPRLSSVASDGEEEEEDADDIESDNSSHKKQRGPRKRAIKVSTEAKAVPPSSSVKKVSSSFAEESKLDRLTRLAGILQLTSDPRNFDVKRALKTLDKISEIDDISKEEFLQSEVLTAVKAARKANHEEVRRRADELWESWKRKNSSSAASTSTNHVSSIPPTIATHSSIRSASSNSNVIQSPRTPHDGSAVLSAASKAKNEVQPFAVERGRAKRLLNDVIGDASLTARMESLLISMYPIESASPSYFEAVTKLYTAFKAGNLTLDVIQKYVQDVEALATGSSPSSIPFPVSFHTDI